MYVKKLLLAFDVFDWKMNRGSIIEGRKWGNLRVENMLHVNMTDGVGLGTRLGGVL